MTIPFYGQYEVGKKLKWFLYAGPYVSVPLGVSDSNKKDKRFDNPNPDTDIEIGAGLGTGIMVSLNDFIDLMGDMSYKTGINKSLSHRQVRLFDLGINIGLRYRF